MADDQARANIEEAQPQPAMPTGEQTVQEPSVDSGVAQQEVVPTNVTQGADDLELPENASERTKKNFEKMRQERDEYRRRLLSEQSFRSMQPAPAQNQPMPLTDEFGNVNIDAISEVQREAHEAKQRAARAEHALNNYVTVSAEREAYAAHPEVDPSSERFDADLYDAAQALAMHSQAFPERYGNRLLSYKEAVDLAKTKMGQRPETPKEAAERLTPKEQASLEASGRPTQAVTRQMSDDDFESLRERTRRGDREASLARLRNIPEVGREE